MPYYRNVSPHPITTDIGEDRYQLEPGQVAEIPERMTYVIARRGLPLQPVALRDVKESAIARPRPTPPPRKVRVPGVASGSTLERGEDAEDKAGEPPSREMAGGGEDGDGDIPRLPPSVARGAAARQAPKTP